MTKYILLTYISLFPFVLFGQHGNIFLTIKGIDTQKGGEISAGIFEEPNFPKVGKQLIGKVVDVSAKEVQVLFENVPTGNYALVVFQDIDKNKDLKTNFVGFPKEPIGFSRDAKIQLGPPAFKDAMIRLQAGETLELSIHLR